MPETTKHEANNPLTITKLYIIQLDPTLGPIITDADRIAAIVNRLFYRIYRYSFKTIQNSRIFPEAWEFQKVRA